METTCIHCDCGTHHLDFQYDDEYDHLYAIVEVKPRGFWSALKEAWKLFQKTRTGCYEEVILNKETRETLYNFLRQIEHSREIRKEGR